MSPNMKSMMDLCAFTREGSSSRQSDATEVHRDDSSRPMLSKMDQRVFKIQGSLVASKKRTGLLFLFTQVNKKRSFRMLMIGVLVLAMISSVSAGENSYFKQMRDTEGKSGTGGVMGAVNFFLRSKTFWLAIAAILAIISIHFLGLGNVEFGSHNIFQNSVYILCGTYLAGAVVVGLYRGFAYKNSTAKTQKDWREERNRSKNWYNKVDRSDGWLMKWGLPIFLIVIAIISIITAQVSGEGFGDMMVYGPMSVFLVAGLSLLAYNYFKPSNRSDNWVTKPVKFVSEHKQKIMWVVCLTLLILSAFCTFGDDKLADAGVAFLNDGGASMAMRLAIMVPSLIFLMGGVGHVVMATLNKSGEYSESKAFKYVTQITWSLVYLALFIMGGVAMSYAGDVSLDALAMFLPVIFITFGVGGYKLWSNIDQFCDLYNEQDSQLRRRLITMPDALNIMSLDQIEHGVHVPHPAHRRLASLKKMLSEMC